MAKKLLAQNLSITYNKAFKDLYDSIEELIEEIENTQNINEIINILALNNY